MPSEKLEFHPIWPQMTEFSLSRALMSASEPRYLTIPLGTIAYIKTHFSKEMEHGRSKMAEPFELAQKDEFDHEKVQ
jgi:hypothetical protein